MADELKTAGLRLKVDGQAEFKRSLAQINSQLRSNSVALKKISAEYGKNSTETAALARKKEALAEKLSLVREKSAALNAKLEEAAEKYGENSKQAEKLRSQIGELEVQEISLTRGIETLDEALRTQGSSWTQLGAKLESVGSKLKAVGDKMASVGKALMVSVTAPVVAAGTAAVKAAADFEKSFAQVQTIMDTTALSSDKMAAGIREMSVDMGKSAAEISEAVYNAISATGDTAGALDIVRNASKLATAGFTDTSSALGVLTTSMNAYGYKAEDLEAISDSLLTVQNLGVTTISELSAGMGKAIATASAYSVDLSNVEAAYISLTKAGISTRESTTYLSGMVKELGTASSKVANIIQKQTGRSFGQLMKAGMSLADVLGILLESCEGDTEALMNLWGSAEAGKAANAVVSQGLDAFNDNLLEIGNSAGLTQTAYETMTNTMAFRTEKLKATLKDVAVQFGQAIMPTVEKLAGKLQKLVEWLNSLSDEEREQIIRIAAIAAAAGPVLFVLGKATSAIGSVVSAVGRVSTAIGNAGGLMSVFKTGLSAVISPVGLVVAGIAALAAAFAALWKNNEEFRDKMTVIWDGVIAKFNEFGSGLVERLNALGFDFQNFGEVISAIWNGFCEFLGPVFESTWEGISTILSATLDVLTGLFDVFSGLFSGDWDTLWNGVEEIFSGVWNSISGLLDAMLNLMKGLADTFLGWFGTSWDSLWSDLSNFFTNTWNSIKSFFQNTIKGIQTTATSVWNSIKSFFSSTLTSIQTTFSSVWQAISQKISNAWNTIKSTVQGKFNEVKNIISNIGGTIKGIFDGIVSSALNWGRNLIQGFINGIKEKIRAVRDAVSDVTSAVGEFLGFHSPAKKGEGRYIVDWGENMISGFLKGVGNMQSAVRDVVGGVTATAASATQDNRSYTYGGITIQSVVVREDADIKRIAKELYSLQTRNSRAIGVRAV